jgi:ATP-dependent Lon protease
MVTALASLLTGRSVKSNIGMTGEVTLRGKVLPIGGLKEKVLAAARAGLDTVILPAGNEPDLEDLPENVRSEMKFILVDTVDEVLVAALDISNSGNQTTAELSAHQPTDQADNEETGHPVEKIGYLSVSPSSGS